MKQFIILLLLLSLIFAEGTKTDFISQTNLKVWFMFTNKSTTNFIFKYRSGYFFENKKQLNFLFPIDVPNGIGLKNFNPYETYLLDFEKGSIEVRSNGVTNISVLFIGNIYNLN